MTEIRVPIKLSGWIVLKDLQIDRVEVDRNGWEYGPIPYVSPYGEDPDVIVFRDAGADPRDDRYEGDVNITQPIHDLIDQHDVTAHHWVAGAAALETT